MQELLLFTLIRHRIIESCHHNRKLLFLWFSNFIFSNMKWSPQEIFDSVQESHEYLCCGNIVPNSSRGLYSLCASVLAPHSFFFSDDHHKQSLQIIIIVELFKLNSLIPHHHRVLWLVFCSHCRFSSCFSFHPVSNKAQDGFWLGHRAVKLNDK